MAAISPCSEAASGSSRRRWQRSAEHLWLLLFLLLPLAMLAPALLPGRVLAPVDQFQHFTALRSGSAVASSFDVLYWDDFAQLFPWQKEAQRDLAAGRFPLWNHRAGCGAPLLANSQTSALSPPWLLLQLSGLPRAQGWLALWQLWLCGAGMFLFLRGHGLFRSAAAMGGLAYQCSGWSMAWTEFPNRHAPAAYLPLCLWLLDRAMKSGGRWTVAAAAAAASSVLASHLQFEFYLLCTLASYAVWNVLAQSPRDSRRVVLLRAGGVLLLAMMIAAPQWLPSLELGRWSSRAAPPSMAGYLQRVRFTMPGWWLVNSFLPGFFGYPSRGDVPGFVAPGSPPVVYFSASFYEFAAYLGPGVILLAALACSRIRRCSLVRYLLLLLTVSLLLATGSPLNAALYFGLPGYSAMAGTARMLYVAVFAVAALAAVGTQQILELRSERRSVKPTLLAAGIVLTLMLGLWLFASFSLAALQSSEPSDVLSSSSGEMVFAFLLLCITTGVAALAGRTVKSGEVSQQEQTHILELLLLLLCAAPLVASGLRVLQWGGQDQLFPMTPEVAGIQRLHPFRVVQVANRWTLGPPWKNPEDLTGPPPLPPNTPGYYGIGSLESYDSLNSRPYVQFVQRIRKGPVAPPENGNMVLLSRVDASALSGAGVDLLISTVPLSQSGLSLAARAASLYLYRVNSAAPRASSDRSPLEVSKWDGGLIRLRGASSSLRVLETALPGWQLKVDGNVWRDATPATSGQLFLTETIPRGPHDVTFAYRPMSFRFGFFLSCFAASLSIAVLLVSAPTPVSRPLAE